MKKLFPFMLIFIIMFTACKPATVMDVVTTTEFTTITEIAAIEKSDDNIPVIWVDRGSKRAIDEENSRFIGVTYQELDLLILGYDSDWGYEESFREIGFESKISDVSTLIAQKITTRNQAANVGNVILKDIQEKGYFPDFELMFVQYDKTHNIWILTFWENFYDANIAKGSSCLSIAINGNDSEIIRMWVME